MRRRAFTISTFVCEECGMEIQLPRMKAKQREQNHIKDIFCVRCGETQKHLEKREFDF